MNGFNYRMEIGNSNITLGRGLLRTVQKNFSQQKSFFNCSWDVWLHFVPKDVKLISRKPLCGENSKVRMSFLNILSPSTIFLPENFLNAVGLGNFI